MRRLATVSMLVLQVATVMGRGGYIGVYTLCVPHVKKKNMV